MAHYPNRGLGYTINSKGYKRLTRGPHRGKFEHRAVMADLAAVFCFYPINPRTGLPDGFHVDHLDHCRSHNCYQNLLLLDARIHDYVSWCSWLNRPHLEVPGQELPFGTVDTPDVEGDPMLKYKIRRFTDDEIEEVPW